MKIKYLFTGVILSLITLSPLQAQIGKEMKAFRNQKGITVTMLTPSLYNLYKQHDISLESEKTLRSIREINVMHVDLQQTAANVPEEITRRVSPILENESKYTLVRSQRGARGTERLYVTRDDERVTSLVLWSEEASTLSIIELKGDIVTDHVSEIANALGVKGLERLALINAPSTRQEDTGDRDFLKELAQRFGITRDSTSGKDPFDMFEKSSSSIEEMLKKAEEMFRTMNPMFEGATGMNEQGESISNGLEVTRENGKTRVKVNATNSEIVYLIDGKEYVVDSLKNGIPEDIATVDLVQAPKNPKKSYVVINTNEKAGTFNSYANGVLKYKYLNQEYTVNPEKLTEPSLVIDNRLTRAFTVDPKQIIQIRPATEIERQVLRAPFAQVIIVTDKTGFAL